MSTVRVVNIQHTDATEPNIVLEADGTTVFASGITISGGTNLTVSGTAEFASGTVSAPSITFIDDNNTGIYEPAVDTVAITTAATERLRINSTGKVGIGTTSPQAALVVSKSGEDGVEFIPQQTTATNQVLHYNRNTSAYSIVDTRAAQHIFRVGGSEAARIDSSGNVLLGKSSQDLATAGFQHRGDAIGLVQITRDSGEPLQLNRLTNDGKLIEFRKDTASVVGAISIQGSDLGIEVNGSERVRIDSSGRLLVGTSSFTGEASAVLEGSSAGGTTQAQLWLNRGQANPTTDNVLGQIIFGDATASGRNGAMIQARVDSSWGSNDYPSRLGFFTTSDGASSPTERMRIDSSGNVGIGTSSINQTAAARTVVGINGTTSSLLNFNHSDTLAGFFYAASDEFRMEANSSRPLTFRGNGSERMRIDSSGRLLVGTSSARNFASFGGSTKVCLEGIGYANSSQSITNNETAADGGYLIFAKSRGTSLGSVTSVNDSDLLGSIWFQGADGTALVLGAKIDAAVDGTPGTSDMPTRLVFSTTADGASSPTERMRITAQGFIKASNTGSYVTSTSGTSATQHEISNSTDARDIIQFYNTHASNPYGIYLRFQNATPNNTTNYFLYCSDGTVQRVTLRSNGGIANYQSNNVNLCDEREKKNIETLDSTWGCLKNWELKKFHYNEDADTDDKRYGVIAQQVAPHCPEVITDWVKQKAEDAVLDEDGNVVTPAVEEVTRMGVKEQQMMWMAIKALQEAQARIETLEAEVAALKGAQSYSLLSLARNPPRGIIKT